MFTNNNISLGVVSHLMKRQMNSSGTANDVPRRTLISLAKRLTVPTLNNISSSSTSTATTHTPTPPSPHTRFQSHSSLPNQQSQHVRHFASQGAFTLGVKDTSSSTPQSIPAAPAMTIKGIQLPGRSVYLDMQATSPLDFRVLDAMMPYMTELYGNPHSRTHHFGWEAEDAVEDARTKIGKMIGADSKEIVFTSGATESNNAAIKGVARFYSAKKRHIITTQTEHKCVLDSCRQLQQEGFDVTYLPVKKDGLIDLAELEKAIRPDTALVSVMMVNNEIGVVQPVAEIGKMCRSKGVFFHCDAAQACGKIPVDVNAMNIDLLSISGHKLYGPKGVGALYVRRRPRVRLQPIISGGGQERGMRSGTLSTPLCVGLGEAAKVAMDEMENDHAHVTRLADRLYKGITSNVAHVQLNGSAEYRYPGNLNLSFAYVEGESLLMALKEIAVSSGSACTSASLEPSYVLRALGVEEDLAHTSIRFGIGRFTTEAEVDYAIALITKHVTRLRDMSPLWEMVQEGIDLKTIQWSQ